MGFHLWVAFVGFGMVGSVVVLLSLISNGVVSEFSSQFSSQWSCYLELN